MYSVVDERNGGQIMNRQVKLFFADMPKPPPDPPPDEGGKGGKGRR
jgi:hypothetical protein